MLRKISFLTICGFCLFFISCGSDQDTMNKATLVDTTLAKISISDETINGIINSIPSPLETVSLIKENGLKYDESYLNPSENYENYKSKYGKAFAIGIYSADLGYLNLFEKNVASVNYIFAVRKLSDDLNIGQFFDFETLKRLASSNKNMDSLLYISTACFNNMDNYLRKNKRSEQSALIIIGAWLEGLYFETQMAKTSSNKKLKESIGSQKVAISSIMAILDAYQKDEYFNAIRTEMKSLKKLYDKVEITYNYVEPEVKEVNGELVVVEKSESVVTIPDTIYSLILTSTSSIRQSILEMSN